MKRCHVDANVLLRFLRNDDPRQSPAARRLLAAAQSGEVTLVLSAVTVAEVCYALRASYRLPRPAAHLLADLLQAGVFELEDEPPVLDALARMARANVDFGDAYLAARAAASREPVATFDGDFAKFPDIKVLSPGAAD